MTNPDTPSVGFFAKWTLVGGVLLGLLIILPTTVVLMAQPAWLGFQREAMKESHQYVEAKESMLLLWVTEYDEIEVEALKYEASGHEAIASGLRLQQETLLARIKTEATRIPEDALNPTIVEFLERHP